MAFQRKPEVEWLDEDRGNPAEVASALRSLAFVNRFFGGSRVHRLLLERVSSGRKQLQVLEAAAGRATALSRAALQLDRRGIRVEATLLDRQQSHLPLHWPPALPTPCRLTGDALAIPLPDKSVDVVICCLFLHHLSPQQATAFLVEAARVARIAVCVNDLERTRVHYALARLFSLVDPSRLSRHDGPISVRQAYSRTELKAMLAAAGAMVEVRRHYLFRLAGIAWIQPARAAYLRAKNAAKACS